MIRFRLPVERPENESKPQPVAAYLLAFETALPTFSLAPPLTPTICRRNKHRNATPQDPGPRDEGASFLGLKQTLLLSYCRELCSYAAAKGRGEAQRGGGAAGRLVELRTVMEKLRPMDR